MGRDTVSSEGFSLKQLHHDSEPLHPLPFPSFYPCASYTNIVANSFPKWSCLTHPRCEDQGHKVGMNDFLPGNRSLHQKP